MKKYDSFIQKLFADEVLTLSKRKGFTTENPSTEVQGKRFTQMLATTSKLLLARALTSSIFHFLKLLTKNSKTLRRKIPMKKEKL